MRRFVAGAAVAALLIAAGCGDDDGDGGGASSQATDEFCQGFNRINEQFSDINPVTSPEALRDALDMLRDLDPPDEIADEYATVLEGFERLSNIDVTDQDAVYEVRDGDDRRLAASLALAMIQDVVALEISRFDPAPSVRHRVAGALELAAHPTPEEPA